MYFQSLVSLLLLGASLTNTLPVAPRSPQDFNAMLDQYNQLQEQTMLENMEMQQAQASWNPLESVSKQDATSKKEKRAPQDPASTNADAFKQMLDQFNELQQQTMAENLEMQAAQASWNPLESASKQDATSKKEKRAPQDSAGTFTDAVNQMLQQYNDIQEASMLANMEAQNAEVPLNTAETSSK